MGVAPDGSPVDVYLRLPPCGEAELDSSLRGVGLVLTRRLDERGAWVEARLYSGA